ncbi:MAG TPA: zinc ABC transporter substrate-binding protein [Solirubrobacteraceae bacterium]|nr:zinc ABC transporter substrate-binding protein [Solirubrobacteraceae bacterium]
MKRALVLLALALLAGCGGDEGGGSVVATTTQVADLARNVAGERAEVAGILTPNADPHGYEPRARDVKRLVGAKVVLRSGGEVDAWLEEARRSAGSDAHVVTLGERTGEEPHWWQDPRAAIAAVGRIRGALTEADPGGKTEYAANADRYVARLRALDRAVARCIATIPPARRKLVTTHDALGAYARRYGLEVIATVIPSRSTRGQASAGETAELVRTIRREKVPAVFAESSVRADVERAIAREAGAGVSPPLWADSLGPEESPGATYVGSIEANTHTIAEALGGDLGRCPA